MEYKILEANGVENENIDGGAFNHLCSQGKSGIIKDVLNECGVSSIGNVLYLDTGLLLLNGIRIKIISKQEFTLTGTPAIDTNYSLVAKVELKENRDVSFYLDIKSQPELVKDNLYKNENGIYELEIATFIHNVDGNISSLYRTCELIGSTQPTIIIDTELSSTSENAVQNKVINEALEGKLDRKPTTESTYVYAEQPNAQKMIKVSYHQPQSSCIVAFASSSLGNDKPTQNGTIIVPEPFRPYQVANKKYADTTYTHAITFLYPNGTGYIVYIQSPRPEPFTLQEIQSLVVLDDFGIPAYSIDYNAQYIGTMTPTQYRGYSYSDEYGEEYYFGIGGDYTTCTPDEIRDRVL